MEKIYLCGPTVYAKAHIGNIRPILTFDINIRAKRFLKQKIFLIHNITDIDDKIITKAQSENVSENLIAQKYQKHYLQLLKILNIQEPNLLPKVTENIAIIIDFITLLIDKNVAYVHDGNVWFDVSKIKNYGAISHQLLANMHFTQQDYDKKNHADFALWKKTTIGQSFASPWGYGRPGWHTECAALINHYNNGKKLALHGGGVDLIFPHHENENAQFLSLHDDNITQQWMHVGHLNINAEKMSKSLNNVIDTENFIDLHGKDTLRMLFLITNPTSPITLNTNLITNTKELVKKFNQAYVRAQLVDSFIGDLKQNVASKNTITTLAHALSKWQFAKVMKELNMQIKQFYKIIDRDMADFKKNEAASIIITMMQIIGFDFTKFNLDKADQKLYKDWQKFRHEKNFIKADQIRKQLQAKKLI